MDVKPTTSDGIPPDGPDPATIRPRVRVDLKYNHRRQNGEPSVIIEDPLRSKYFQVGQLEYTIVTLMDGKRSLVDIAQKLTTESAPTELNSDHDPGTEVADVIQRVFQFLCQNQLLTRADLKAIQTRAQRTEKGEVLSRCNPIYQQFPVCYPGELFTKLNSAMSWFYTWAAGLVWCLTLLVACYAIASQWPAFSAASAGVLAGGKWLWMLVIWLVLKLIHEAGHASACHRFGGSVGETGFALICFMPVAYVDVSSAWKFSNKWHRIMVGFAGMYFELFIAALAAIAWCQLEPSILRELCYQVILVAGISSILFNANPLMKFDGYFMLADYCERPGLYQQSQTAFWDRVWAFFLGTPFKESPVWIGCYGAAVFLWRIVICIGLLFALSLMFSGFGVALAFVAFGFWTLPAIMKLARWFQNPNRSPIHRRRLAVTGSLFAILSIFLGGFVLVPTRLTAPGVVEFTDSSTVRAEVDGFIQEIHVDDQMRVDKGHVLVTLSNPTLEQEYQQAEQEWNQSRYRVEAFRSNGETAAVAAEVRNQEKIRIRRDRLAEQVAALQVRAKVDGIVQMKDWNQLHGQYVSPGAELMILSNPDSKKIIAAISQHQLEKQTEQGGLTDATFFALPQGTVNCQLEKLDPRAIVYSPNPMLAGNVGGGLPVRSIADPDQASGMRLELLEPHLVATFRLQPQDARHLRSGQRFTVALPGRSSSIAYQTYRAAERWLGEKFLACVTATQTM